MKSPISIEDAKAIAEAAAKKYFEGFVETLPSRWIEDDFLAESHCWLFLRNAEVKLNHAGEVSADAAFVVSRLGKVMIIADHDRDVEKLRNYLATITRYLAERNE